MLEHNPPVCYVVLREAIDVVTTLVKGTIGARHMDVVDICVIGIDISIQILEHCGIEGPDAVPDHMEYALDGGAIRLIVVY